MASKYSAKDVLSKASFTIQIIEDVAIYKAQIFSSNGNIFGIGDKSTDISLVVWKGLEDITSKFTNIVWKRFTSKSSGYVQDKTWKPNSTDTPVTKFTLSKEEIDERAKIQVEVYSTINNIETLVAIDYINFIDVNDLQGSPTPPSNPKKDDLWLDTSVSPPKLKVWDEDKQQWIDVFIAGEDRRNLLRNSNFYKKTLDYWNIVGVPAVSVIPWNKNKWARINSDGSINDNNDLNGIEQTINNTNSNSPYSFQMLAKAYVQEGETANVNAKVCFYSINETNVKTLIETAIYNLTETQDIYTNNFSSLSDTKKIQILITGNKQEAFDYLVTNIKLENYPINTEWELAIEDVQDALDNKLQNDQEDVFNALTNNGEWEGLYSEWDDNDIKRYYLNASYIKSNTIIGNDLNLKGNLTITKTDDNGITNNTFSVKENGDIEIDGILKSANYSEINNTGYRITTDGTAILNQAIIRGDVILPNAGMTNYSKTNIDNNIRIWAGANYEDRENAPFKVFENGDLWANNGIFSGTVEGKLENKWLHINNGQLLIDDSITTVINNKLTTITPENNKTHISLTNELAMFNTDIVLGDIDTQNVLYSNDSKTLTIKDTTIDMHCGINTISIDLTDEKVWHGCLTFNTNYDNSSNSKVLQGFTSHNGVANSYLIGHSGTRGASTYGDICFRRAEWSEDIEVNIAGNLSIRDTIKSPNHSIEMKSVENEGWGFYVI